MMLRPKECAASGAGHSDGPHGINGETQCAYCGRSPNSDIARVLRYLAEGEAEIRASKANVVWADTMARAADVIRDLL